MMSNKKIKLLIVDDDPVTLKLLECALTGNGFDVLTATSGEQAIDVATAVPIDIGILDYRMAGLSGLDAGRIIQQLTSAPFVLMSAFADRGDVLQAAGQEPLQFLTKPIEHSEVFNAISITLSRSLFGAEKRKQKPDAEFSVAVARAVTSARSVCTAIGLLMLEERITRASAAAFLLRRARDQRRRAADVAEEIIQSYEADFRKQSNTFQGH